MINYSVPKLHLFMSGMYETLYFMDRTSFHRLIYVYRNDYKNKKYVSFR